MSSVVLILISDLEFSGAQRQVIELANNINPQRYTLHVCTLADYVPLADSLNDRAKRLHIIQKRHKYDFSVVPKLRNLLKALNAQVIHTFLFDADFYGRLAGCMARTPVIIGSERNTDYVPLRRHIIAYGVTKWCSDLIVANSNAGANFGSRTFGVPRSKYRVIHNGVNVERFQPVSCRSLREQLGVEEHHRLVGMFASFKQQKNHELLLYSAKRIIERVPNVRFLFVGDELYKGMSGSIDYKKRILSLIQKLQLQHYCLFAGNRQNIEEYYNLCDLTVLPSLFEGTPNVALESMACGVPVVATDVSDNKYIIPDCRTGFIVPLGDAKALSDRICKLLLNHELRQTMSTEARRWTVQEFSTRRMADKMATVYDEMLLMKQRKKLG